MLEKPALADERIMACLHEAYGLQIRQLAFLPLGADQHTAVYRAVAADATAYFVKLRSGAFDETGVALPAWLASQGIEQIIAPLATRSGQRWAALDGFMLILYPFVAGRDAYALAPSDSHWIELGSALRRIHALVPPPALEQRMRRESFASTWRDSVREFVERAERDHVAEAVAARTADLLIARRAEVLDLVERSERLAQALQRRRLEYCVCHGDLHAGNILIAAQDQLYLVDWDTLVLAPKERDLMYAGGGQMAGWRAPDEEERLFYQGYGATQVDHAALAYYRYERIVEDIAAYCQQLLLSDAGGADREQWLRYLMSNFEPNSVREIAYQSDRSTLPPAHAD